MPTTIWRGTISFGLVTIAVSLMPAEKKQKLAFRLLDKKSLTPIKNQRVNEETGKPIEWNDVVRGYEIERDHFIVVSDDDLKAANVEATQTIDVLSAVKAEDVPLELFETPYFLQPERGGKKAYALLREALKDADRIALAKIVIRTRQHLCALVPKDDMLLLEILRYPYELRDATALDLPGHGEKELKAIGVTKAELDLAHQLVATIAKDFDPDAEEYRDVYRDDVMALIEKKAKGGEVTAAPAPTEKAGEVVDIMSLLRRSLDEAKSEKVKVKA
jgi:DNA end-binding protein Ku